MYLFAGVIALNLNRFKIKIVSKNCYAQFLVAKLTNGKNILTNVTKRPVTDVLDTPQIPVDA